MITAQDLVEIGLRRSAANSIVDLLKLNQKWERIESLEHFKLALQRRGFTEDELLRAPGVAKGTVAKLFAALDVERPSALRKRAKEIRAQLIAKEAAKARLLSREGAAETRDRLIAQAHRGYERRISKIEAAEQKAKGLIDS